MESGVIRHLSLKGHGVFKSEKDKKKVYFLKGLFPGDEILFFSENDFKILKASEDRIPLESLACPYAFNICQGCPWMPLPYEKQLEYKLSRFHYIFEKMGYVFNNDIIKNIIPSPDILAYRNRCQLKVNASQNLLGYVGEKGEVLNIEDCPILNDKLRKLLLKLREVLPEMKRKGKWSPPQGSLFKWVFLDIDDDLEVADIPTHLQTCKRRPFKQGNTKSNVIMKKWLKEKLCMLQCFHIVELYAGSGNFSQVIADYLSQTESKTKSLDLFEIQACALEKLFLWGNRKKEDFIYIHKTDLSKKNCFYEEESQKLKDAELLILDPPREGFHQRNLLKDSFPCLKFIIYISCELDSYARDAVYLMKRGWKIREVQPLDQFPHTPHLEILSIFEKEERSSLI